MAVWSDECGGKEDGEGVGGREVHLERSENELAEGLAAPCPSQREGRRLFFSPCAVVVVVVVDQKSKSSHKKDPHTAAELGLSVQGLV